MANTTNRIPGLTKVTINALIRVNINTLIYVSWLFYPLPNHSVEKQNHQVHGRSVVLLLTLALLADLYPIKIIHVHNLFKTSPLKRFTNATLRFIEEFGYFSLVLFGIL